MIVLVELAENGGYDFNEEAYSYKEIGEVFGPFDSVEEAEAFGKKVNSERGYYYAFDHKRRVGLRDFEVREVTAP
jgi:hypothetical protein